MFIHVRDLEIRARPFDTEIAQGVIDYQDVKLRQIGPLKTSGEAKLVMELLGEIRVAGHLAVTMEADCDRCLEPARVAIDSDFELFYRPIVEGYGEEKSLDAGEAEMGFYDGDGIELNDVFREFVLLTLPMQRVCQESCKGICPACGLNRNLNQCQCQAIQLDDRWAALKELKQ